MGLLLNGFEMRYNLLFERLLLPSGRGVGVQSSLEVAIHEFIRIQFRRVTREKEDLDAFFVILEPGLNDFAVVNPEVVEDQEHLPSSVLHQSLHEPYQYLNRHRFLVHHESHGAAIINRRDQVDPLSFGLRQDKDRRLTCKTA